MRTLGIIPARKRSKRLKGKNIRSLYGIPLVEWTMRQAYQSETLTDVIVATDSKKVASLGRMFGFNIPFLFGEGFVFFFFFLKKLIGAKREGMLDVW